MAFPIWRIVKFDGLPASRTVPPRVAVQPPRIQYHHHPPRPKAAAVTSTPEPIQSFFDGNPDWWQDFFSGPALDFVRDFYGQSDALSESNFVERALGLTSGARVLDVPCGAGRWSVQLATRAVPPRW